MGQTEGEEDKGHYYMGPCTLYKTCQKTVFFAGECSLHVHVFNAALQVTSSDMTTVIITGHLKAFQ